ncbi:hypothetical protein PGT21_016029 [Puccinia graminis f. sp. tritici]|uniref:Uncharacterized protein n=1 Tax=Puccinia graminis f. sp. tritici TaxID=56615 RepID=A0A5B0N3S7_PUCGR|nr:hypothetical protein PGTUg99_015479 [Puccinia graminis f. sp. tritici]KAA1094277.1 hypothetical protein PGT21_016029 [Puccinia graminis f. sp. tritici]
MTRLRNKRESIIQICFMKLENEEDVSPPKNSRRDENGFEEYDNYLIKATEQTNKSIARQRRKRTQTSTGSDSIDFNIVPEGSIHSHSRDKPYNEEPMEIQDDDEEDDEDNDNVQDSGEMVANKLEDILEVEEEEEHCGTTSGPNNHADSSNPQPPEPPKPQKKNHCPPSPPGVCRGKRQRFERLAHWRGEKVVYGLSVTPDGHQKVLGVVDVVRVPTIAKPPQSFRATKKTNMGSQKINPKGLRLKRSIITASQRKAGI